MRNLPQPSFPLLLSFLFRAFLSLLFLCVLVFSLQLQFEVNK